MLSKFDKFFPIIYSRSDGSSYPAMLHDALSRFMSR